MSDAANLQRRTFGVLRWVVIVVLALVTVFLTRPGQLRPHPPFAEQGGVQRASRLQAPGGAEHH